MYKFKIISKNLRYKKSDYVLSVAMLILFFTVTLLSCSILNTTQRYIAKNKNHNIDARTLFVRNDFKPSKDTFKKINTYEHVVAVFPRNAKLYTTHWKYTTNKAAFEIYSYLVGANEKTIPTVTAGKTINFNSNEILIPEKIKTIDGKKINGKDLIGNIIEIQIEELHFSQKDSNSGIESEVVAVHKKQFKIMGTYDSDKIVTWENQIIAPFGEIEGIRRIREGNLGQFEDIESTFLVTVDKYDSLQSVSADLVSKGYNVNLVYRFNSMVISVITTVMFAIAIIVVIVAIMMLGAIQIRNVNKRTTDIGLMKALGFTNKIIIKTMIFHTGIISFTAFAFALLIACVIAYYLGPIIFENCVPMNIFNITTIVNLIIAVIVPLLSAGFSLKKILNISPVVAMKEVE